MELQWRSTRDGRETTEEKADSGFTAFSTDTGIHYKATPTPTGWKLEVSWPDDRETVISYKHAELRVVLLLAQDQENSFWSDLYCV